MRFVTASVASCFGMAFLAAPVLAASRFDTNDEGWAGLTADTGASGIPLQTSSSLVFHPTGGNPAGYVSIADPDNFDTFFRASSSFLGNQGAAVGGFLSYDTITDMGHDYNGADVVIKGNGTVLVYDVAPTASSEWSTVTLVLSPGANWHLNTPAGPAASLSDFQTALANVSELWITAEYHAGLSETTGLDNVTLTVVPEPASMTTWVCFTAAALMQSGRLRLCASRRAARPRTIFLCDPQWRLANTGSRWRAALLRPNRATAPMMRCCADRRAGAIRRKGASQIIRAAGIPTTGGAVQANRQNEPTADDS